MSDDQGVQGEYGGDTERLQQVFVTDGKRTAYVLTLHTYVEDAAAFRDQVTAMVYSFSI